MLRQFRGLVLPCLLLAGCTGDRTVRTAGAPPPTTARILHFYASPGLAERGRTVMLCYGVENAQAVRLEPPLEPLQPAPNRCIQFAPREDRTYKLVATGADGKEVAESFTLRVQAPARPQPSQAAEAGNRRILLFLASPLEVGAGQAALLCYGVRNARTVRLDPGGRTLEPSERRCLTVTPSQTTTYTLSVSAEDGAAERDQVTVRVK